MREHPVRPSMPVSCRPDQGRLQARNVHQGDSVGVRLDGRYGSSILTTSIAFAIVAGASLARADNAEARAWFAKGAQALKAGKLDEACSAFEYANDLEPGAGTLINVGICRERNHQLASALAAYRKALARVKNPDKRRFAQQHAAALQSRLSYLTIVVSEQSRLEGLTITQDNKPVDSGQWNRARPVDGGNQVSMAQAPGYETWQMDVQVPVQRGEIRVDIPALVAVSKPEPPPTPDPEPPSQPVAVQPVVPG